MKIPTLKYFVCLDYQWLNKNSIANLLIKRDLGLAATDFPGLYHGSTHLAERVGFEPTIPFLTGYCFSRAGPSAARPPLRKSTLNPGTCGLISLYLLSETVNNLGHNLHQNDTTF